MSRPWQRRPRVNPTRGQEEIPNPFRPIEDDDWGSSRPMGEENRLGGAGDVDETLPPRMNDPISDGERDLSGDDPIRDRERDLSGDDTRSNVSDSLLG